MNAEVSLRSQAPEPLYQQANLVAATGVVQEMDFIDYERLQMMEDIRSAANQGVEGLRSGNQEVWQIARQIGPVSVFQNNTQSHVLQGILDASQSVIGQRARGNHVHDRQVRPALADTPLGKRRYDCFGLAGRSGRRDYQASALQD